jgi:hypothetical protein
MLRQLDPPYQEAVTLTELRGVTQADAAKQAGMSFSGRKSRVQRARKRLRTTLEECCRLQLDRRGGVIGFEPRVGTPVIAALVLPRHRLSARASTVPADSRMKARLVSTAFSRHQGLKGLTAAKKCSSIPIHLHFAEP